LINRTKISTAVASARNNLISRIFLHEEEEYLGLKGNPPERTIYLSLFHSSGMHRNKGGRWGFYPPPPDDPCHWRAVWNDLLVFLKQAGSVTLKDVLKFLSNEPYGLRTGVAILLIAAFLRHYRHNLVLFEKGTYQVQVTEHHFMRMFKNPSNFSFRFVQSRDSQAALLDVYVNKLDILKGTFETNTELTEIAENIYKWFIQLSPYAMQTRRISSTAISVRTVLKKAIDPVDLLYQTLPSACGMKQGFGADPVDHEQAESYMNQLNSALNELDFALQQLRNEISDIVIDAFVLGSSQAELRHFAREKFLPFVEELSDYKLKSFLMLLKKTDLSEKKWLESIASLFTDSNLASWQDRTINHFKAEAKGIAGRLKRWVALLLDQSGNRDQPDNLVGVHIVNSSGSEYAFTVYKNSNMSSKLELLREKVRTLLANEPQAPSVLAQLLAESLEGHEQDETKT
jgi:hypothetical protein